jgi:hypothetical protein
MENPNGKNEVKLSVPCCNDEELEISFKTKETGFISEIFTTITKRIGLDVKVSSAVRKGGGDG